jgi:probable phosphoglycerate mutase
VPAAVRVVLVRHGESLWNAAGIYQGQSGPGLSDLGHEQAELVAEHLACRFDDIALLAGSDLPRVAETAAATAARLRVPLVVDARLREIDLGSWTGRRHDVVAREHPQDVAAWQRWEDGAPHGGERVSEVRARAWAAIEDLRGRAGGATLVVFTHGGVIRVLVGTALGLDRSAQRRLAPVANASVTVLRCGAGWSLSTYNETGHLVVHRAPATAPPVG